MVVGLSGEGDDVTLELSRGDDVIMSRADDVEGRGEGFDFSIEQVVIRNHLGMTTFTASLHFRNNLAVW